MANSINRYATLKMANSIISDNGKYSIEISVRQAMIHSPIDAASAKPPPEQVVVITHTCVSVKSAADESPSSSPHDHVLAYSTRQGFSLSYDDFFPTQGRRPRIATTILDWMNVPFFLEDQQAEFSVGMNNETKLLKSLWEVVTELDAFFLGLSPESMQKNKYVDLKISKIECLPEKEFEKWKSYRDKDKDGYDRDVTMLPEWRTSWRIAALHVLDRPRDEEVRCGAAVANGDGSCPICLEVFHTAAARLRKLPCGHTYHENCILRWIENNQSCPYCRAQTPRISASDFFSPRWYRL